MPLFPKAIDQHKLDKPRVPNGLGAIYVLLSTIYLFALHVYNVEGALALASCILFGGFMGLFDDWVDLRWKYKAVTPIFAAIPLIALRQGETVMATYIFGKIDFGIYYYLIIAPLIVTIITNSVNQLGGLNGLETVCPLIVMLGLMVASPTHQVLLIVPVLITAVLAFFNFRGRIFVGNVGSFALGITIASYAIIANIEQTLVISCLPYIFNASLINLNYILWRRRPSLILLPDGKLTANHRRSLQTLIAHGKKLTERQIVSIIASTFIFTTALALLVGMQT
ncbi:MAG TPA: hypothetical protein ENG27_01225 [Candidatus Bathyarchaeota archaeon]|nr:hypothetical protein [Candidatus Bathyarchaeota archaeon]